MSFNIWRDAVISYLKSKGITEWCEGEIGGGYAIFGDDNVMQAVQEFNKSYIKSSVRHGELPNVKSIQESQITSNSEMGIDEIRALPERVKIERD